MAGMNITLKKLRIVERLSQETTCFTADVYVDGVKAGTAENHGQGGPTNIHPFALRDRMEAHAKTLPMVTSTMKDESDPSGFFRYAPNAESMIDDLVGQAAEEKAEARMAKKLASTDAKVVAEFKPRGLVTIRIKTPRTYLWVGAKPGGEEAAVAARAAKEKLTVERWEVVGA